MNHLELDKERGTHEFPYDLLVIGGGINGCGIARDGALRGFSVALYEKEDFAVGATGASSGMIHGGLRYLMSDPSVAKLACKDSGYIQKLAPHLIFRIPFVLPLLEGDKGGRALFELAEVYFEAYDRYQPFKYGKQHTRLNRRELNLLEPGISPRAIEALTTDEWGIDAFRLTLLNAVDAAEHSASINTYHQVLEVLRDGEKAIGLKVRDLTNKKTIDVFGKVIVNATGSWSEKFCKSQKLEGVRVRPTKGVHIVYGGRLVNHALISKAVDGRQIFLCPHQNCTYLGCTDDDYYGDLDRIPVVEDEIEYLLQGMERVFPQIRRYHPHSAIVGCRPTVFKWGESEDDLSREHIIVDHALHQAPGLLSLVGGKLASYRIMSEEVVDKVAELLGLKIPCTSHIKPLPGGETHDLSKNLFADAGLDSLTARRMLYRHGARAVRILEMIRHEAEFKRLICECEPVCEGELRYCIRNEGVRNLADLSRRVRLGYGTCGGSRCLLSVAEVLAQELTLPLSVAPEMVTEYLSERWVRRTPVLFGAQLASEELSRQLLLHNGFQFA